MFIRTYRRHKFDFDNIKLNVIKVEDIAHSLSHICRYNGHLQDFYSVAQHSVLVSRQSELETNEEQLAGLFHDSGETYVHDICRPLRKFLKRYTSVYEELQEEVTLHVFKSLGLTYKMDAVKIVDARMCVTEMKNFFGEYESGSGDQDEETYPAYNMKITPWKPKIAKTAFLSRYYELSGEKYRKQENE